MIGFSKSRNAKPKSAKQKLPDPRDTKSKNGRQKSEAKSTKIGLNRGAKIFKKHRKRFIICFSIFVSFVLYFFFSEQINTYLFDRFDSVEISGNELVSKDDILVMVYNENNAIDSISNIKAKLTKIGLIKYAIIRRKLPRTLSIKIVERNPIFSYYNTDAGEINAIDDEFQMVNFAGATSDIPLYRGPGYTEYSARELKNLYNTVSEFPDIQNIITEIEFIYGYRYNIVLANRILILLPEGNVRQAFKILNNFLRYNDILNKNIKRIDLRVSGKVFFAYYEQGLETSYVPSRKTVVYFTKEEFGKLRNQPTKPEIRSEVPSISVEDIIEKLIY